MRMRAGLALLCLIAALPTASAQLAQQPSEPGRWIETEGGRVRLVLSGASPEGVVEGALEIDLKSGWKTYWSAPGPAGIPPVFDARASHNLTLTEVEFPVPTRFDDAYGTSIGYDHDVTFPLAFRLLDPSAPAELRLDGFMGICEEICIPVQISFAGPVMTGMSTSFEDADVFTAARAALPAEGDAAKLTVEVTAESIAVTGEPVSEAGSELFAGVTGDAALGEPIRMPGGFEIPILRGTVGPSLAVVVVVDGKGTEYIVPLAREAR